MIINAYLLTASTEDEQQIVDALFEHFNQGKYISPEGVLTLPIAKLSDEDRAWLNSIGSELTSQPYLISHLA